MEGLLILLLLLGVLIMGGMVAYVIFSQLFKSGDSYVPAGFEAKQADPRAMIVRAVLRAVNRGTDSDLENTEIGWITGDPPDVLTLTADISQFEHMRPKRGLMQWQGVFEEQHIHRRWARRPSHIRSWEGIQLAASLAIPAVFNADRRVKIVRFWIGDILQNIPVYRVSIEALRDRERYDVRYDQTGRYLSPIIPHGDDPKASATSIANKLAEHPTDFEHQVAEALESLGLAVEVVGGSADGGIDIVARDSTRLPEADTLFNASVTGRDNRWEWER